jgi:hypothetical protein
MSLDSPEINRIGSSKFILDNIVADKVNMDNHEKEKGVELMEII